MSSLMTQDSREVIKKQAAKDALAWHLARPSMEHWVRVRDGFGRSNLIGKTGRELYEWLKSNYPEAIGADPENLPLTASDTSDVPDYESWSDDQFAVWRTAFVFALRNFTIEGSDEIPEGTPA